MKINLSKSIKKFSVIRYTNEFIKILRDYKKFKKKKKIIAKKKLITVLVQKCKKMFFKEIIKKKLIKRNLKW